MKAFPRLFMTEKQFQRAVKRWYAKLVKDANATARKQAREQLGMVFVKTYTVNAHFRKMKSRSGEYK